MIDDDADKLAEVSKQLPAIDLDSSSAERIARRARRGPSSLRWLEPIVVAILATSLLAWAVYKVVSVFG